MENDVLDLQDEIELLQRRIEILENKEKTRKAFFYFKLLIKIIFILATIYGIWYGYNYVVNEIPHIMEEKIKELNPLKLNQ